MQTPREIHLAEEWAGLGRALGVVVRRPFLIVLGSLLCAGLGIFLASSRAPVHQSSTSLQLADPQDSEPLAERLHYLQGLSDVAEALPLVTSDEVLAQVVRPPVQGSLSTPEHPERPLRLGLVTWVEDATASPLSAWWARTFGERSRSFRLLAAAERLEEQAPSTIRARFEGKDSVVLSTAGKSQSFPFRAGKPMVFAGLRVTLAVRGQIDGRSWQIESLSEFEAMERVRSRVSVSTPDKLSGVVRVTVRDSDPVRSSELAAAIAAAFLLRDTERISSRALETVSQVEFDLGERANELAQAEFEVARIRGENPDVLHPERSAQLLGEARIALEDRLRQAQSLENSLFETVERLRQGDYSQASRMGSEMDDVRILKLLEAITTFEDQRLRVGSLERSGYADVLQIEADNAARERKELEVKAARLHELATRFAAGDDSVMGVLGDALTREGATPTETLTRLYLTDYSSTSQRLITLRSTYTEEWWEVLDAKARLASLREHILTHLETKAGLILADVQAAMAWERALAKRRDARPGSVRTEADAAIQDLWMRVVAAFEARLEGSSSQRAWIEDSLREVLGRLTQLPEDQRRLARPTLERDGLTKRVGELSEVLASARLAAEHASSKAQVLVPTASRGTRIGPRMTFGGLVGLILGLLLTFGLATVQERSGGGSGSGGSMGTGLALLGEIPSSSPLARGPSLLLAPDGTEASAQRSMRCRIDLLLASGSPLRSLGVRALDSEGAAQSAATAAGLALAWAEAGKQVLLVDAGPGHVSALFGMAPGDTRRKQPATTRELLRTSLPGGHPNLAVLPCSASQGPLAMDRQSLALMGASFDLVVADQADAGQASADQGAAALDAIVLVHGPKDWDPRKSLPLIGRMESAGLHLIGLVRTGVGSKRWRRAA